MGSPNKVIWDMSTTGAHVITEQTWFAARETLAIQLYNDLRTLGQSGWIAQAEAVRDTYRLMAQRAMYGEAY